MGHWDTDSDKHRDLPTATQLVRDQASSLGVGLGKRGLPWGQALGTSV